MCPPEDDHQLDALGQLVARDQIRQLAERYALAVDGKDIDGVAELFVEDVDNGRYGPGRVGVRAFYDQALRAFHCSMHLVANHVIDFAGDGRARGVVYCRAQHHVLEPEHWFDLALAYWDTYECVDGRWLFRRRRPKAWYRQHVGHPTLGPERAPSVGRASGSMRGTSMPDAFPGFDAFWSTS